MGVFPIPFFQFTHSIVVTLIDRATFPCLAQKAVNVKLFLTFNKRKRICKQPTLGHVCKIGHFMAQHVRKNNIHKLVQIHLDKKQSLNVCVCNKSHPS